MLPRRPNNGNDDTRGQLGVLEAADRHHRLLFGTMGRRVANDPASMSMQRWRSLTTSGSRLDPRNLNEHSLFNDTEVNLVTDDPALARRVREELWSEHLAIDCSGLIHSRSSSWTGDASW